MRFIFLITLLTVSSAAFANPQLPISVKDRLRILLWTEGLNEKPAEKVDNSQTKIELPEEITRPLRNL